jgi:glycosyltransferase involved in cell wall biosynthesis
MRLLFLNYECPPTGGGAGFATLALARELVSRGHTVDILTARVDDALAQEVVDGVIVRRVRTHRRNVHEAGMLGALSFVASAALALPRLAAAESYDVVHYYFGMPTGLLSLLPGAHRRIPYVLSLRGSDVPGYERKLDWWHRCLRPLTRRVWGGAHAVVANSEGLCALARRFDPERHVQVIHNGVHPGPPRTFEASGRPLRVLTVSRLIERKGIDTLIRAIALLKARPIELAVVGDGPRRDRLAALARELGVADRVQFLGFLPQAQVRAESTRAGVFALASHSESCSMALLQAIGSGTPVIATRVGGNPELVMDGDNGLLFEVGDAAGAARALARLQDEPGLCERFGRRNHELAHQKFSWQTVASRYEALFQAARAASVAPQESGA